MQKEILAHIHSLKKEMVKVAEIKGLNDAKVLELSQEIDHLHNQLNRLSYGYAYLKYTQESKRSRDSFIRELALGYDIKYATV